MTGAEFSEVDIDLLADYIGGVLDGTPDESVVAALITDDPAWAAAYESLAEGMAFVGAELGRFAPEPMPADLAAQLEAMFTAPVAEPEPVLPGTATPRLALVRGADAPGDSADPVPKMAPARPGRRLRWAAPIAVAAGAIAFVGFGLDYLAGTDRSMDAESSAGVADSGVQSAGGQIYRTGTDYTLATLDGEPVETFSKAEPAAPLPRLSDRAAQSELLGGDSALLRLSAPTALQDCLTAIERENAGGPISVLSVDYARFTGTPAVIVRFTAENGTWGWASGPACGTTAAGAATLGKVPVR